MREIKFRGIATHDYETSTDGVEKGDWVYGHYYFDRPSGNGVIVTTLTAESGGVGSGVVQANIFVDHKTISQYTGLKDKNGVEIYDGDILTTGLTNKQAIKKVIVEDFEDGMYWFKSIGEDYKTTWRELHSLEKLKVIGNIYEHSHLLKQ